MTVCLLRLIIGRELKCVHKTGNAVVRENALLVADAQDKICAKKRMMADEKNTLFKNKKTHI